LNALAWLGEQRRIYFENAGVVRDFRAQMRTIKPFLGWVVYLGLIFLVTGITYYSISSVQSPAQLQDGLAALFITLVWLLGILVSMTTPALTISSVISEFERGSIDLVMSAPVHPKYFFVGKLLSAYRYAWLLLVLGLPFAAVGVVMGGFTYGQVLQVFYCMSLQALIAGAVGMAVAVLTRKTVNALGQSYAILFLSAFVLTGAGVLPLMTGAMIGGKEAPFFGLLVPGMCLIALDTHTTIAGFQVPNWILATLFTLGLVRLLLLGAAAGLQFNLSKEIKGLRIGSLIAAFLMSVLMGFTTNVAGTMGAPMMTGQQLASSFIIASGLALLPVFNYLSCWQFIGERKYLSNGIFSPRLLLAGTPAGNVPFLATLFLVSLGGFIGGLILARHRLDADFIVQILWAPAFWLFFIGLGWWSSIINKISAQTARRLQGAILVIVIAVVSVVLGFVQAGFPNQNIMGAIHPLAGAASHDPIISLIHTVTYAILGAILLWTGELKRRQIIQDSYGRTPAQR